jgi:hypothetical protein
MFSTKMLVVLAMRFSETWIVTASMLNQAEDMIKEVPTRSPLLRNGGGQAIESTQDVSMFLVCPENEVTSPGFLTSFIAFLRSSRLRSIVARLPTEQ